MEYPGTVRHLLDELERLPGIGPASAQRIAYWIMNSSDEVARGLADAIVGVKESVHFCPTCFNYADGELCDVCANDARDKTSICVVAEPKDVSAIERTHEYRGLYHVLGGVMSPMDDVTPDDLNITELLDRLADTRVSEVIIALDSNTEGNATAIYLSMLIKPLGIKVTRPSRGVPEGTEIERVDEVTLGLALENRDVM